MNERPWEIAADGVVLAVRLTPKGARDAIEGIETGVGGRPVLRVRVRALPREGEANEALVRLVAKAIGVPAGAVSIVAGRTSRLKRLKVVGAATALSAALERICALG
ncbi:MAG: DUF167 domain-containing protein [Hyphomicrobiales bacterium]|nr:DUF167 domain-containing protein [Hyphomicrobiales bacterium]